MGERRCHGCKSPFTGSPAASCRLRNGILLLHCGTCLAAMAPGLLRFQHDREATDRSLRAKYGIGLRDYERLYQYQNGKCAICGARPSPRGRRLAVDHDHETGEVRGLLCGRCNLTLGQIEDDHLWLEHAGRYLKNPEWAREGRRILTREEHILARQARKGRPAGDGTS